MSLHHDSLDAVCFWVFYPGELVQALMVCRDWCRVVKASNAWQKAFIWFWHWRQKPGFIRAWWKELVDQVDAYMPATSITADPCYVNWNKKLVESEPFSTSCQDPLTSWYQKYACAARDTSVRRPPTEDELCCDSCFDPSSGLQFPRCWFVLNRNGVEDLPVEFQFHPDGRVIDHCTSRASVWTWKRGPAHSSYLELTRSSDKKVLVFLCFRDVGGGFVLHDLTDRMICSRELTLEEHIWYSRGVMRYPPCWVDVVQALAVNSDGPDVQMPWELTYFEHSAIRAEASVVLGPLSVALYEYGFDTVILRSLARRIEQLNFAIEWPSTEQARNTGFAIEWPGNSVQLRCFSQKAIVERFEVSN